MFETFNVRKVNFYILDILVAAKMSYISNVKFKILAQYYLKAVKIGLSILI